MLVYHHPSVKIIGHAPVAIFHVPLHFGTLQLTAGRRKPLLQKKKKNAMERQLGARYAYLRVARQVGHPVPSAGHLDDFR